MRKKIPQLIVTFSNTPEAIAMEKYCLANEVPGRLIPVPTQITAGCGLAWKTDPGQEQSLLKVMDEAKLHWEAMRVIDL